MTRTLSCFALCAVIGIPFGAAASWLLSAFDINGAARLLFIIPIGVGLGLFVDDIADALDLP